MKQDVKQRYKFERSDVEQSFTNQLGLKKNPEYERWADCVGVEILKYFSEQYKGVVIEIPKLREKSAKSLLGKIKNLQIERLSKLYAIEGISDKDKKALYSLIEEIINENREEDSAYILQHIKSLLEDEIENINLQKLEEVIMIKEISRNTKTALLRILISKIEKSTLLNKNEKVEELEEKYGEKAYLRTGLEEDDIIHYSSIRSIKNNETKLERLRNAMYFLKANDLRGMKMVVVDIPDDLKTENKKIREILEERKEATNSIERIKYNHLCTVEMGKEFYTNLANNEQLLKKLHMEVIADSSKHKKKVNGYEAEHIKFINTDEPEYTLELQFKSEYVEILCRGEGTASHENRPGKARVLPQTNSDEELIKKLEYMVPKYQIFKKENGKIKIQKFGILKSAMSYFQDQISPDSEEYEKIIEVLSKNKDDRVQSAL